MRYELAQFTGPTLDVKVGDVLTITAEVMVSSVAAELVDVTQMGTCDPAWALGEMTVQTVARKVDVTR